MMALKSSGSSKNSTTVRPSKTEVRLARAALQTAFAISNDLGATLAERMFITPKRHARPDRELAVLATARFQPITVTLRSPQRGHARRTLAAWRWGFGPTVLLVHGWEGRGTQLGAFVRPLVEAGMSVVAFDAPGHGDSPDRSLYLTDLADCVADVAAQIDPHAIIAHSFGAAAVLLAHSRAGLTVPRTIFVSPNAIVNEAVHGFSRYLGLDSADETAFVNRIESHTGVPIAALAIDQLTRGCDSPLLVVHDRDDREVPFAQGERLAAAWPGATLHETHELGHRRILRDPAVVAAVIAFAREGVSPPVSDLVREVDRYLDGGRS